MASVAHQITHVGLHHFAARYSDAGIGTPRPVVRPKVGKTVKGQIQPDNGAKDAGRKAGAKTITIRLKDREKSPHTR